MIPTKLTSLAPGGDGFHPLNVKMSQHSYVEAPYSGKTGDLNSRMIPSARESAAESAEVTVAPVLYLMVTHIRHLLSGTLGWIHSSAVGFLCIPCSLSVRYKLFLRI